MKNRDFDAIVIGAGPAGSSAAALLARNGWSVALVEKQAFPRRKVCGECIAASNLPLLDALDVGQAFAALAGPPLRRVALMSGARTVVANLPASPHPVHRWGRALGREQLDALLLGRAQACGAVVLQPWSLQSLTGRGGDHECRIVAAGGESATTLRAPLVIAAHGSWEPLPVQRAAQRSRRRPSDLLAFKANFRDADLAPGLLPVLSFRGGYGGMVVADGGLTTLACCVRADRLRASRAARGGASAGEVVEDLLRRECEGVDAALRGARRQGAWLAAGPLAPGIRLRVDGADAPLAIGNAAGEAHPIVGEGISMALQSAWLLCDLLVRHRDVLLDGAECGQAHRHVQGLHAARWRAQFAPRLRLAALLAHVAMRRAPMPLLDAWPGLLTQAARWSGKLRCAPDVATIESLAR